MKLTMKRVTDTAGADGLFSIEAAHGVDIGGGALDQLTGGGAVMVGEGEALDVIVEVVAQANGRSFGGGGGPTAAEEGKDTLKQGQQDKAEGNPDQLVYFFGIAEHVVGVVTQEVEEAGMEYGGEANAGCGKDEEPAVAGEHAPQTEQAVVGYCLLEIECGPVRCWCVVCHRWG